ncbi:hypothetical protein PTRA_b0184 [Pseudoalteromonas translucida KMM 520]|uniref:Type I restriction modification DNA specificity domain-containing protein n=1 Tax=Pseudoalteromonas translucida KMM 520 TaxID=1315283 RepID=A0A0U2VJU4_9GAMM|nr:restriction endonuclease subunit S [Pseudoalteromonas translucida]ALS34704.1 hypothetical protein PTRA_b0184 [Pseudoalteromonas translucida KMM 520]
MAESKIPNQNAEQLITEHLDIWTTAIEQKSSSGRGSSKKFSLHGIKKLRELILELAVRGKLVPQDPNDEPAAKLLERIAAEKAQLVKDKKIKKPKALPEISEEEKPFELPQGWEFSRLGVTLTKITDGTHHSPPNSDTGDYLYISAKNIKNNGVQLSNASYITKEHHDEIYARCDPEFGDLLYIKDGATTGIVTINQLEKPFSMLSSVALLKCSNYILNKYLLIALRSPFFYQEMRAGMTGVAITRVTLKKLDNAFIPIPALEEQHRIVAKVDELMSLCDALEAQTENSISAHQTLVEVLLEALLKAPEQTATPEQTTAQFQQNWQRLSEHFDTLFTTTASIDTLKQTILQLAVMGKLVPQNPNDEPAAKLLERIAAEKAQLIEDKKIKKQKPLPEITDEEKPLVLPQSWSICRLAELLPQFQNGASSRGDKSGREIIVLRLADIKNWEVCLKETRLIQIEENSINRYQLNKDDILIIRVNGSADIVGRLIACRDDFDAIYCDHFIRMRFPFKIFTTEFISLLGSTDLIRKRIAELFVSTAGQKTVNQTHIGSLIVTVPPLEEQQRIVTKVDELISLCDQLKARLTDAQTTKLHLTDAIVEQAL